MKRNRYILLAAAILAAMSTVSCEKETVIPEPVIKTEENKDGATPGTTPATPSEPYTEFSTTLPQSLDTLVYKGFTVEKEFAVNGPHPEKISVSIKSATGADAAVTFETEKGKITFTPSADCGGITVAISDGTTEKEYVTNFDTYFLGLDNIPETFGEGEAFNLSLAIKTNIPEDCISITSEDWIRTYVMDGFLHLDIVANENGPDRNGTVILADKDGKLSPVTFSATQKGILKNAEGMVQFKDRAFKDAMVSLADKDGDGEVSPDEALLVETIDIVGKGVKDLSGLDAFKSVWKLDARDNDIIDADILKELHYLYWLDLRGNKNLRTFDLTGCSMHFDHCEFELTDELQYKVVRRQVGAATYCKDINEGTFASVGSDPKCEHAVFIDDPEVTKDWSVQNTIHLLRSHTAGYGKTKIVFTGLGYTDRDIKDGTFGRIMTKAAELFQNEFAGTEFLANVDVLYMDRIMDCHDKWKMKMYDSSTFWMKNAYKEETSSTLSETYGAVTGVAPEDWMCANQNVLVVLVDIIPNLQNGSSVMSARASYKYGSYDNPNCQAARFVLTKDCYYNEGKDNEPYAYTWRIEDCYLNGCYESFVKSCNL